MNTIKNLTFAAVAALSLGVSAAMAQDSAFFTEQAEQAAPHASSAARSRAVPALGQPDAGSSDVIRSHGLLDQPLYGADGNG